MQSITQYRVLAANGPGRPTVRYTTDYLEAEAIAEEFRCDWPTVTIQRRQITQWQTVQSEVSS